MTFSTWKPIVVFTFLFAGYSVKIIAMCTFCPCSLCSQINLIIIQTLTQITLKLHTQNDTAYTVHV